MYHKSFERERNFAGYSPRSGIIVLAQKGTRNLQAESRRPTPQPTTRGVVFHHPLPFLAPASPSIPNPKPLFPPSLHSFLSAVFRSSFCFRRTRLTVYPQPHWSDPRCLSSLSLRLSSRPSLILFGILLSLTSPICYLLSSFTFRSSPSSSSNKRSSRLNRVGEASSCGIRIILSLGVSSRIGSDRPTRAVGLVRNSCLPCNRSPPRRKGFRAMIWPRNL